MYGKIVREMPPTRENGRNSEGAFVRLKDGRLMFAWTRYGAAADDGSAADIYAICSEDEGETWGEEFVLLTRQELDAHNIMSVSFLRMQNEDLGMFFLRKKDQDCICLFVRSADEGKTWSKPVLCTRNHGYYCVNNDRIIRTATGRILVPAALAELKVIRENGRTLVDWTKLDSTLNMFASDDDGYTWNPIAEGISIPVSSGLLYGVQEPGLLQLEENKIWCYIRNDSGKQYECFSEDDGETWTQPLPSQFSSAVSPLCTKRLKDGRIVAVWNPVPLNYLSSETVEGTWTGGRTPLALSISSNNGERFFPVFLLETDKRAGFCYTAIFETEDKALLLAYCAGNVEDGSCLNRLRMRKVSLDELK